MKQTLIIAGMAGMVVCCAAVPVLLVGLGSFSLGGVLGYFDASLLPWGIGLIAGWCGCFSHLRAKTSGQRGAFLRTPSSIFGKLNLRKKGMTRLADYLPMGYAFGAGMVSTVNPCGFAMLPAYLSLYMGAEDSEFYQRS